MCCKINIIKSCKYYHKFCAENKIFGGIARRNMRIPGHFGANFCHINRKVKFLKLVHDTGSFSFVGYRTYFIYINNS